MFSERYVCCSNLQAGEETQAHTHFRRSLLIPVGIAALLRVELFNRRSRKGPLCNGWLAHTLTSCCMAKILSSFYTSSRLWLRINGRAEERYPIRRASVLPLQVVERRLRLSGLSWLSWLSWLSSLESGVFVGTARISFLTVM